MKNNSIQGATIAVIGLGYVGLPLAVAFGKRFDTVGYDISRNRVSELDEGIDSTLETSKEEMGLSTKLNFTSSLLDIEKCNVYIVTVPTPVDNHNKPDLQPLISASMDIGSVISEGDVVIYESTVYPGATEEVCVPLLEEHSGLKYNKDFTVGYSPERINPGDKTRSLENIVKVTSGSTPQAATFIDQLYSSIVEAGTCSVSSISVAEASKVIENTQRDLNIALINELAIIFNRLGIPTKEVLKAAGTKWNFMKFEPGLVGGHCISVDPYYLTYKAQEHGYHPKVILAGRETNDSMGRYIAENVIKLMTKKRVSPVESRILICGISFKENCPDLRNTRVIDIVKHLKLYGANVDIYDPWVSKNEVAGIVDEVEYVTNLSEGSYDAAIIAVPHSQFSDSSVIEKIERSMTSNSVIYDIKGKFESTLVDDVL